MKKRLLTLFGAALLILNTGIFFCPADVAKPLVFGISALLGAGVIMLSRFSGTQNSERTDSQTPHPLPVAAPSPLRPEAPTGRQKGVEAAVLLGLLQEHGRLVDFVSEDISSASDADLGSAARVVHAGCAKVLGDYFSVGPIRSEPEGAVIVLEKGCDVSTHRLLGSVPEHPPYSGRLLHPGWKLIRVNLPEIENQVGSAELPVIAPAEIEIKG